MVFAHATGVAVGIFLEGGSTGALRVFHEPSPALLQRPRLELDRDRVEGYIRVLRDVGPDVDMRVAAEMPVAATACGKNTLPGWWLRSTKLPDHQVPVACP